MTSNTLSYSLLHDQQHIVILIVTWPATHCHTHCYYMTSNTLSYSLLLHDQQHIVILIVTWPATHCHTHCYMTSNTLSYSLLHDQQHRLKLMVRQGVWIICHTPKHITGEAPYNIPSIPPSKAKSPLNARRCPWKRNIPPWQSLNNNGLL